jgi:hypothetical protein
MKKEREGEKGEAKYICKLCDFYSNDKTKFDRHLETNKHKKNCSFQEAALTIPDGDADSQATLLNALKAEIQTLKNEVQDKAEFQSKIVDTQEKFQTKLVDTLKELLPQMAATNVTNNNSNNRISNNQINIFLNKKCADAMSIQQFARQLTFTIDDVLMKKQDALVKVINQNLDPLEVNERPMHCTNVARRRWHVKDETDGWKKDDGSSMIRRVNNSLIKKSPAQYAETFPDWFTEPKHQSEYMQIIGMTSADLDPKAEARVLTTVGQTVHLDGTLMMT